MPRPPNSPAISLATLAPERAIPVLEELIFQAEILRHENPSSPKRDQWITTGEGALRASLGVLHPAIRSFGTAQCGVFGLDDTEIYLLQQANRQLDSMVAILRSAVEQLRWQLPEPTQIFLRAGTSHDAFVEIRKILQLVSSNIFIADSYVDETIWPLLTNVPSTAKVRIMTMTMKGDFALEARAFTKQHRNPLEVRRTSDYHDRFIIVDAARYWHLGTSIKDAGTKACAISEIISRTVCDAIKGDLQTTWNSSAIVPL